MQCNLRRVAYLKNPVNKSLIEAFITNFRTKMAPQQNQNYITLVLDILFLNISGPFYCYLFDSSSETICSKHFFSFKSFFKKKRITKIFYVQKTLSRRGLVRFRVVSLFFKSLYRVSKSLISLLKVCYT